MAFRPNNQTQIVPYSNGTTADNSQTFPITQPRFFNSTVHSALPVFQYGTLVTGRPAMPLSSTAVPFIGTSVINGPFINQTIIIQNPSYWPGLSQPKNMKPPKRDHRTTAVQKVPTKTPRPGGKHSPEEDYKPRLPTRRTPHPQGIPILADDRRDGQRRRAIKNKTRR